MARRQVRDVAAVQPHGAALRKDEAGDCAQQRGFAAAGRAEQRDEFAARDREVDAFQRSDGAEGQMRVFHFQAEHGQELPGDAVSINS